MSRFVAGFRRWKKAAGITLAAATFLTLMIGVMHMRFARRMLARLGGCPVGNAPPERYESMRNEAAKSALGTTPSPARPALVFKLDQMTLKDAEAWAKTNHLSCDDDRKGTLYVCDNVPAEVVGEQGAPIGQLALAFSLAGKLVNISAQRTGLTADQAASILRDASKRLEKDLGPPMKSVGEPSVAYLTATNYSTATVSYTYQDYMAEVSATNVPAYGGVAVREHFLSARN